MRVEFATDIGQVRTSNQDDCRCGVFSNGSAWAVVCDGMGGANGGEIASAVAVKTIAETLTAGFSPKMERQDIRALILNAVGKGNSAVFAEGQAHEELHGMGTTVVVLVGHDGYLHVAHVGDSRAYLKSERGLAQITVDHSFVQDLVNFGQITPEQARFHPQRNIVTRVLGVHEEVQCDYSCFDFSPGDLAIACTDGLTAYVEEDLIMEHILRYGEDEKLLSQLLVDFANRSGGSDNITVAVMANR